MQQRVRGQQFYLLNPLQQSEIQTLESLLSMASCTLLLADGNLSGIVISSRS
jgi:hypothetical protein